MEQSNSVKKPNTAVSNGAAGKHTTNNANLLKNKSVLNSDSSKAKQSLPKNKIDNKKSVAPKVTGNKIASSLSQSAATKTAAKITSGGKSGAVTSKAANTAGTNAKGQGGGVTGKTGGQAAGADAGRRVSARVKKPGMFGF